MRRELLNGTPAQLAALLHLGIGKLKPPNPEDDAAKLVAQGYSPEMAARMAGGTLLHRDRNGNVAGGPSRSRFSDGPYA